MNRDKQKQQGASSDHQVRNVKCPTCGKTSVYSQLNPVRPFCSETCKTGDLAAWASDEYRLPTKEPADPHSEDMQSAQDHHASQFNQDNDF